MDGFPDIEDQPSVGPDLAVRVTGEAAGFVSREVAEGRFADAEAVVAEALALLQDEDEAGYWRGVYFRQLVQHGLDQADRGELIEVTDPAAWLEGLGRRPAADQRVMKQSSQIVLTAPLSQS